MEGGEIFIPKLPTTDIGTLAEAIAPGVVRKTIGIRPGEKLHETLISDDECRRTSDLGELLVVWPEFVTRNSIPQIGTPLPEGFNYCSDRPELRLSLVATRNLLANVA